MHAWWEVHGLGWGQGRVLVLGGGQGATVIYCAPVGPCIMEEDYEEDNETNTHFTTVW